jgi:hypothetical protein
VGVGVLVLFICFCFHLCCGALRRAWKDTISPTAGVWVQHSEDVWDELLLVHLRSCAFTYARNDIIYSECACVLV